MVKLNEAVNDFELPATGGMLKLSALLGKPRRAVLLSQGQHAGVYHRGQQFRDLDAEFKRLGCPVFGISRDSIKSHESFKAKLGLPFELLSDEDEAACQLFGAIKLKNMYGKQVRGIERSTFVIDAEGLLRAEWRGVKVPDHAQKVLDFVRPIGTP